MSNESKEITPRQSTLLDIVHEEADDAGENHTILIPIGAFLYSEKTRIAIACSDQTGHLYFYDKVTPEGFDPSLMDEQGRIVSLNHIKQLSLAQVSLEHKVNIATFRSIRTLPSVAVRIDTENTGQLNFDEDEILKVFIGQNGGIAVFSGAGLPEENALVIERGGNGNTHGIGLFIRPKEESGWSTDSVGGLYSFLLSLNNEFTSEARFPLQTQALASVEQRIQKRKLGFDGSEVREALHKTQVIAHARIATKYGSAESEDFIKNNFPDLLHKNALAKALNVIRSFFQYPNFTASAKASLDKLIINDTPEKTAPALDSTDSQEAKTIKGNEHTEHDFLMKLKTVKARRVAQECGPAAFIDFHSYDNRKIIYFIADVLHNVNSIDWEYLDDTKTLLARLRQAVNNKPDLRYNLCLWRTEYYSRYEYDSGAIYKTSAELVSELHSRLITEISKRESKK